MLIFDWIGYDGIESVGKGVGILIGVLGKTSYDILVRSVNNELLAIYLITIIFSKCL